MLCDERNENSNRTCARRINWNRNAALPNRLTSLRDTVLGVAPFKRLFNAVGVKPFARLLSRREQVIHAMHSRPRARVRGRENIFVNTAERQNTFEEPLALAETPNRH